MNIVNTLKLRSVEISNISKVLHNLYSCIDFANTRYEILKDEDQLNKIKLNDGYVTVQFQGIAYLIFFCMVDNKKCHILISKQQLKSDNRKNNIRDIKMFYMFLPFINIKYYNGSVLDGKMIKSGNTSNAFIIHEFYYNDYLNIDMLKKYDIIKQDILPSFASITKIDFKIARLGRESETSPFFGALTSISNLCSYRSMMLFAFTSNSFRGSHVASYMRLYPFQCTRYCIFPRSHLWARIPATSNCLSP